MDRRICCIDLPSDIRIRLETRFKNFADRCRFCSSEEIPADGEILILPAEKYLIQTDLFHQYIVIPFGPADLLERCFIKGAKDYLKDPWNCEELLIRSDFGSITLACGTTILKFDGTSFSINGRKLFLTRTKSRIMKVLMQNHNDIVPYELLIKSACLKGKKPEYSLHVHIHELRKSIRESMKGLYGKDLSIENSSSLGYSLKYNCG